MAPLFVRGAIVVLAAVLVAWLALSYRGVGLEDDALELAPRVAVAGGIGAEALEQTRDDLRSAGRISSDNTPLILEGSLLSAARKRREAAVIARRATATEPDNVQAWFLAYATALDARGRAAAKREVARLNPWAADELP